MVCILPVEENTSFVGMYLAKHMDRGNIGTLHVKNWHLRDVCFIVSICCKAHVLCISNRKSNLGKLKKRSLVETYNGPSPLHTIDADCIVWFRRCTIIGGDQVPIKIWNTKS